MLLNFEMLVSELLASQGQLPDVLEAVCRGLLYSLVLRTCRDKRPHKLFLIARGPESCKRNHVLQLKLDGRLWKNIDSCHSSWLVTA